MDFFKIGSHELFAQADLSHDPPNLCHEVAMIAGLSHQQPVPALIELTVLNLVSKTCQTVY
jgi:hypothetical protein